jgi:hypothetical protein
VSCMVRSCCREGSSCVTSFTNSSSSSKRWGCSCCSAMAAGKAGSACRG